MILMSKYKGQHDGKRVKKFGQGPPPFRAMPERNHFFYMWSSLTDLTEVTEVTELTELTELTEMTYIIILTENLKKYESLN